MPNPRQIHPLKIMGILNLTPDSFSDGNAYSSVDAAVKRGLTMVAEGADIIDLGGESTRPKATPVSLQEELDRVLPVLEKLRQETPALLSVDTSKPEVIKAAIQAGAEMINDVRALTLPDALAALFFDPRKIANLVVCLMHMPAEPPLMQDNPCYKDVTQEVYSFLEKRIQICIAAGLKKKQLIADPGFGFGKTKAHNFKLLKQLDTFQALEVPILVGLSRKSFIGNAVNQTSNQGLYSSIAAAVLAASKGASIIRCHDVRPTKEALTLFYEMEKSARI